MLELEQARKVLDSAVCLFTVEQVNTAVASIANQINADYADKNPLVLCVMKGGAFTACKLFDHLQFPLEFDFIQATRYRNTTQGGQLDWKVMPSTPIENRHVLIVDDIYDEGVTLREIVRFCQQQRAVSTTVAVLAQKLHNRNVPVPGIKYVALQLPDEYVFGCGMDYQGYFRNLKAIYALGKAER